MKRYFESRELITKNINIWNKKSYFKVANLIGHVTFLSIGHVWYSLLIGKYPDFHSILHVETNKNVFIELLNEVGYACTAPSCQDVFYFSTFFLDVKLKRPKGILIIVE